MSNTAKAPTSASAGPPELPEFSSLEEEVEFWMTHDASPYWDQMEDVTDSPPLDLRCGTGRAGSRTDAQRAPSDATEVLTVRLSAELVRVLRAKARVAGVPLDDLVAAWLAERLTAERHRAWSEVR